MYMSIALSCVALSIMMSVASLVSARRVAVAASDGLVRQDVPGAFASSPWFLGAAVVVMFVGMVFAILAHLKRKASFNEEAKEAELHVDEKY